jgi:hypothetical protein
VEAEAQSSSWKTQGSLRPKKAHQVWNKVKVMLTVSYDHEGVIHHEEYCIEVLCWLHDVVWRKLPVLWK